MLFDHESTPAGYARTAVAVKTRMAAYCASRRGREYLRGVTVTDYPADAGLPMQGQAPGARLTDAVTLTAAARRLGVAYIAAPPLTATIAAAAATLDLTGATLDDDFAPGPTGVLFLPTPIYQRLPNGRVNAVGALTWTLLADPAGPSWALCAWADLTDPGNPTARRIREVAAQSRRVARVLGPYLLTQVEVVGCRTPHDTYRAPHDPQRDRIWEPGPVGAPVLDVAGVRTSVCTAIAYTLWCELGHGHATVTRPDLDQATTRRAHRAGTNDTAFVLAPREPHGAP